MKRILKTLTICVFIPLFLGATFSSAIHALPTQPKTMLVWTPPTLNTDGTTLTDLAGFRMYCGPTSLTYSIIPIYETAVPTQDTMTFAEAALTDGNYFCAVTSYDTSGNESGYSNEVNFTLVGGLVPLVNVPAAPSGLSIQ